MMAGGNHEGTMGHEGEHGTWNTEHGTWNMERGTWNMERMSGVDALLRNTDVTRR